MAPSKENRVPSLEKYALAPSKKPVCVMHPENAPRMIYDDGFPKDFYLYEYAGATLEVLTGKNSSGKTVRRPALVAKMVQRYKTEDEGAFIEVEMTASLRDLRKAKHPHTDSIAAALYIFYEEKVPMKEKVVKPQKSVSVVLPAARKPVNDLFAVANPLTQVK